MTKKPLKYEEKEENYYLNVRLDLLSLLPEGSKNLKILEIGAGHGATLSYLKDKGIASEVVAIDIIENKGKWPFKNIDKFIYGDIENLDLNNYYDYFDFIILADVLEHLINPGDVLQKLKPLQKMGGSLLISIPNFRHIRGLFKVVVKGDFTYEEEGLFDYTHLRFFCKKNIKELVVNNNFEIDCIISSLKVYKKPSLSKFLNLITLGFLEEFLSVQYLLKTKAN